MKRLLNFCWIDNQNRVWLQCAGSSYFFRLNGTGTVQTLEHIFTKYGGGPGIDPEDIAWEE